MEAITATTGVSNNGYLLFTTSRPSRITDVPASGTALMNRFEREKAWADSIGMDTSNASSWTLTGSTGTKPPFRFEEGIPDDVIEP